MTERKYYHYCYLITNTVDGMMYFGVRSSETVPAKDTKYYGSGKIITQKMKELGKDKFTKDILACFDTRDEALAFEEDYMAKHDCVDNPKYYNLSARSTGGRFDYHEDLKDGRTESPQEKNGAAKESTILKRKLEKGLKAAAAYDDRKEQEAADRAAKKAEKEANLERPDDFTDALREGSTTKQDKKHQDELKTEYSSNQDGSPDGRIHHGGQMGGKRPGAGRPKGTTAKYTKRSAERLSELGFDPMEELLKTYVEVCEDIENTRSISARTSLYNTRQKIMSDLMKYGYRPIPTKEEKEIAVEEKGPMSIILTEMDEDKPDETPDPETKH